MLKDFYFVVISLCLTCASANQSYTTEAIQNKELYMYLEDLQLEVEKWIGFAQDSSDFSELLQDEDQIISFSFCYSSLKGPYELDDEPLDYRCLLNGNYFIEELQNLSFHVLENYRDACLRLIRENDKAQNKNKLAHNIFSIAGAINFILFLYQLSHLSTSGHGKLVSASFFGTLTVLSAQLAYVARKKVQEGYVAEESIRLTAVLRILEQLIQRSKETNASAAA